MNITTIKVAVTTANRDGASTDGNVMIGICGREFHLDTTADDFRQGQSQTFVLGDGSNNLNPPGNDPRKPQLDTGELGNFPVYVHFSPVDAKDNWCLEDISITVNPGAQQIKYGNTPVIGGDKYLWMAMDGGRTLYLKKQ
ncbi:PLAT/LH2 domain-containing protein [Streptomyces sp. ODS28]|uniref:PLAT/LH2 domain-containing protein n=1 Tax=Streptomyces sp. ODS28 TaxID=3136688 RepID=UPI0031E913C5